MTSSGNSGLAGADEVVKSHAATLRPAPGLRRAEPQVIAPVSRRR